MKKNLVLSLVALLAFGTSAASAQTFSDANFPGFNPAAAGFTFSGEALGDFDAPVNVSTVGNFTSLVFSNASFLTSTSTDPSASGDIELDLELNPGVTIGGVIVTLSGNWQLNGDGATADIGASWTVTDTDFNLSAGASSTNVDFINSAGVTFPIAFGNPSTNQGQFTGFAETPINGLFAGNSISIDLNAFAQSLIAPGGDPGASASANLLASAITIDLYIIPEPATLSLLGCGAIALIRRRR